MTKDKKKQQQDGSLGARIREFRIRKGWTQIDLAKGLCTPSMISQIESDRARPSYNILSAIASRLDVPLEKLRVNEDIDLELTSKYKMVEAMMSDGEYVAASPFLITLIEEKYHRVPKRVLQLKLGVCYRQGDKFDAAEELFSEVYEDAAGFGDVEIQIDCLVEYGHLHVAKHDFAMAISMYEKALGLTGKVKNINPVRNAKIYSQIADVYSKMGRSNNALEYFAKAQKLYDEFESPEVMAKSYLKMANEYDKARDYKSALKFAESAYALFHTLEDSMSSANTRMTIADAYVREGKLNEAGISLNMALEAFTTNKANVKQGEVHARFANIYFLQGNEIQALESCEKAKTLLPESHHGLGLIFVVKAGIVAMRNQIKQAYELYEKAAQIYLNHRDYRSWKEVMLTISAMLRQQGNLEEAVRVYDEVVQKLNAVLQEMGVSF